MSIESRLSQLERRLNGADPRFFPPGVDVVRIAVLHHIGEETAKACDAHPDLIGDAHRAVHEERGDYLVTVDRWGNHGTSTDWDAACGRSV